jgi:hypothetical protein
MDGVIYFVAHPKLFKAFNRFTPFNRYAQFNPATRGRMKEGVERLKRLELFEPKPNLIVAWVMRR